MCYIEAKLLESGEKILLDELIGKLSAMDKNHGNGALSIFVGLVKGELNEARVHELEYTAISEVAAKRLEEIARDICTKYSLSAVVIYHRLGRLKPGETTIYIVTMGTSRKNTNPAMIEALERVKKEVPVFKLEKRSDGEYWVIGDGVRYKRTLTPSPS
ncbi:MAG: molybdenum cofactor biosynthesis protein MoaE [Desulfurococcus sp.]|uniref:molybdenum cofactor biosynthesis protein MoaE n=1 Tax=Desulfurococcus sp. TaxID=51678 RepID=UPI003D097502